MTMLPLSSFDFSVDDYCSESLLLDATLATVGFLLTYYSLFELGMAMGPL